MQTNKLNDFFRKNDSITLEQIKNFINIYETGSLSQAAIISHKTQPAISHNIKKLEEKLNTPLIKRNRGKTISFTEEGHRFYQKTSPIIGQLLAQIDEIENRNTISIGICDDLPIDIQLKVYQKVSQQTHYRVRLLCDFSYRIEQMVNDGRLSFAIIKQTVSKSEQQTNRFYWVNNHEIDVTKMNKLPIVSSHTGCFFRTVLEKALQESKHSYYFSYLGNHLPSQAEAILAGFGLGIMDNRNLQTYPNLVVLSTEHGLPMLAPFQFRCIGSDDNHQKRQVLSILEDIVTQLNDS